MSISRRLARPLLSGVFVVDGVDQLQHPETKVKTAEAVAVPVARKAAVLPQDTETLIRLNGAIQVGAGVLLAIGKLRRLAALALIGSVIPATVAEHRFWEETDEQAKKHERTQFLKNLALLGGLLLAAVDTEGAPSLGWRAKRQARRTGRAVVEGRGRAVRRARKAATAAALLAQTGSSRTAGKANRAAARSVAKAQRATARAEQVDLRKAQHRAAETARKAQRQAVARAQQIDLRGAQQRASEMAQHAAALAQQVDLREAQHRATETARKAQQEAVARAQQVDLRKAQKQAAEAARKVSSAARQGTDVANQMLHTGAGQAGEILSRAAERLPVNTGQA